MSTLPLGPKGKGRFDVQIEKGRFEVLKQMEQSGEEAKLDLGSLPALARGGGSPRLPDLTSPQKQCPAPGPPWIIIGLEETCALPQPTAKQIWVIRFVDNIYLFYNLPKELFTNCKHFVISREGEPGRTFGLGQRFDSSTFKTKHKKLHGPPSGSVEFK